MGDKLILNKTTKAVVFSSAGIGGASIKQLTYGKNYNFFKQQLLDLKSKFGEIDGILFHQGERNHKLSKGSKYYKKDFDILLKKIRLPTNAPIYISQTSICNTESDKELIKIQNEIINSYKNVLRGPNSDLLSEKKYRLPDNCHFSSEGFDALSDLWLKALILNSEN